MGAALASAARQTTAAEFSVTPMRMDLERTRSAGVLTVANHDARPLRLQPRLAEWSQDATGQDVYSESTALEGLRAQMTIGPGGNTVVNVGINPPPGLGERAYRLFLNELPQAGAVGNFAISFALPIFIVPAHPDPRAEIEAAAIAGSKLSITIANSGNQHIRIDSLSATADGRFTQEAGGWYLLAGARRVHVLAIPAGICPGLGRLDIKVRTDKFLLQKSLDVEPGMCAR